MDGVTGPLKCKYSVLVVNIHGIAVMMDDFLLMAKGLNDAYAK